MTTPDGPSSGWPPVDLHDPFHRFGIMDPLCGAVRQQLRADLLMAGT